MTILVCWVLLLLLRDLLAGDALIFVVLLIGIPLWCLFALGAVNLLLAVRRRRVAAKRRWFEDRPELTGEEFNRLFPSPWAPVPVDVRTELGKVVGRVAVARRLLPADLVRATCDLVGISPDDIDWAEILVGLETRFGVELPRAAYQEATVAELVAGCAGGAASSGKQSAPG
jgi:hypothetical protein